MSNTFSDTFTAGTKILLLKLKGSINDSKIATVSSIQHYNKDLYDVTFEESHLKGTYCFSRAQLIKMKNAYEESKK